MSGFTVFLSGSSAGACSNYVRNHGIADQGWRAISPPSFDAVKVSRELCP